MITSYFFLKDRKLFLKDGQYDAMWKIICIQLQEIRWTYSSLDKSESSGNERSENDYYEWILLKRYSRGEMNTIRGLIRYGGWRWERTVATMSQVTGL